MNRTEKIEAEITQIIFSKMESGFAVMRAKDINMKNIFTAVGKIQGAKVGTIIEMTGYWDKSAKYGIQFKVVKAEVSVPEDLAGILRYLGSAFVNSVGPKSAKRIVDYFGKETINILENDIQKLATVPGIGPVRARNIILAWNEQKLFNVIVKRNLLPKNDTQ